MAKTPDKNRRDINNYRRHPGDVIVTPAPVTIVEMGPQTSDVLAEMALDSTMQDILEKLDPLDVVGTVAITGIPNPLPISGSVTATVPNPLPVSQSGTWNVGVNNFPSVFWQPTQPVSFSQPIAVTGTFFQTTQPISGSVNVSNFPNPLIVDTELPAASALQDTTTNPATPLVGSPQLLFNNGTWDRARSNYNSTTGDVNKTGSFTSIAQVNYNARAMIVTVPIAATGALGVVTAAIQHSPDGGATWIALGATSSGLATIAGTTYLSIYVGQNASTIAGISLAVAGQPPRTWRVVVTCTGVLSGFNIPAVWIEYMV